MDNMNNIGSYRSVYMAFGAFKVEPSGSDTKTASQVNTKNGEIPSFLTAMSLAVERNFGTEANSSEDNEEISKPSPITAKNALDGNYEAPPGGYTRIITAKIPDDIASDMKTGTDESGFNHKSGGQELKITINVSGDSRIYTASGVDKNGNAFSKEIDPYNVDPTDTDYAGFATLCAYIRDTEGMADNAMKAVRDAAPEDITEKGNYLFKVGFVSIGNGNLSGAKKLFEQMQNFFEKLMNITSDNSVKGVSGENAMVVRSDEATDNANSAASNSPNGVIDLSDSSSTKSKGNYSRIFEELQEMIQLMIQKMLNEIIGVDDTNDTGLNGTKTAEMNDIEAAGKVAEVNDAKTTGIAADANNSEKADIVAKVDDTEKAGKAAEAHDAETAGIVPGVNDTDRAKTAEESGFIPGVTGESEKVKSVPLEDAMKNSLNLENATEL